MLTNILDMHYFQDLLPTLAKTDRSLCLFYEVKANLNREHIRILYEAGVHRIQPGIESMSDHILKLMRKGTTALRNIQLLKWCKAHGISVDWNILYGFPGETSADYAAMLPLLEQIRFLGPPSACGPVRMDRFSPYFNAPEAFGLINVRPLAPYRYLYPFAEESLQKIAYYFDYNYTAEVDPTGFAASVIAYVNEWQQQPEYGTLSAIVAQDGTLTLLDTRSNAVLPEVTLVGVEKAIYVYCDEMHTLPSILQYCRQQFPEQTLTEPAVRNFLTSLVANHLMISDGKYFLSLAIAVTRLPTIERTATFYVTPFTQAVATTGDIVA
jgi:ribosomal peptide maturation radical SAM protein 1